MDNTQPVLGLGALSKQTSCNIEVIHHFETIGLMYAPELNEGGHRMTSLAWWTATPPVVPSSTR